MISPTPSPLTTPQPAIKFYNMFGILFGWHKASKCKKAIKRARCRIRLLKNKRQAVAKQLRKDLAELIHSGHEETALNRVEQLIEDESLAAAYELLDNFCEFILTQLSYIRRHKDCPNDINEAVSSLIYASARCGDLPELCVIRKLFKERYGERFATTALELSPGNLVNNQLKENLSGKSVPNDVKYRVVDEIAGDNSLQHVLAIQYYPHWHQVKENKGYQVVESEAVSKVYPSELEQIERDIICVNSTISESKPSNSCSLPESNNNKSSAMVPAVQQCPSYILSYPLQKIEEKVEDFPELLSYAAFGLQNKGEGMALAYSSAERVSLPPYPEEMEDYYVDDIEECEFSVSKDGSRQDQRLFKFRSSGLHLKENSQFGCDVSDMDQDESMSEKSNPIRTPRKCKRTPEKKSRRRSTYLENIGIMDIGYMMYYQKPFRSPYRRKQQKPSLEERIPQSSNAQKRLKQHRHILSGNVKTSHPCQREDGRERESFNFNMSCCSLDHPCYFCVHDDKDYMEALSMKPKRGIRITNIHQGALLGECFHCRSFWHDELNQGVELVTIPRRPNRICNNGAAGNENNEEKAESSVSAGSYASQCFQSKDYWFLNKNRNGDSLLKNHDNAPREAQKLQRQDVKDIFLSF